MITPEVLKIGDEAVIVSPSGAIAEDVVLEAKQVLEAWGLKVSVAAHALDKMGRFAGSDKARLNDLQQAINDSRIKLIVCSRGGYGLVRLLDKIDFSPLKTQPKWIVGFSDVTALHLALSRNDIVSLHGIMTKHIAEQKGIEGTPSAVLKDILFNAPEHLTYTTLAHPLNRMGEAKGKLVGGNLSVMYGLQGTPFAVEAKNNILFIEDVGERAYHIDRMMQNLRLSGVLENISGLVVGQFTDIDQDDSFGGDVYDIIHAAVVDYNYPVCFQFAAGHVDNNWPLVMGAECQLKVDSNQSLLKFV